MMFGIIKSFKLLIVQYYGHTREHLCMLNQFSAVSESRKVA